MTAYPEPSFSSILCDNVSTLIAFGFVLLYVSLAFGITLLSRKKRWRAALITVVIMCTLLGIDALMAFITVNYGDQTPLWSTWKLFYSGCWIIR